MFVYTVTRRITVGEDSIFRFMGLAGRH